ncbi:efflux RND transporter periplasmic adaptor subunit [uncultured Ilyobacter sp.]|uniref:efflux RND transporter periplasmic adaptor subunit n=1 Tax=uncultured Ilyobacter sp. TaxID=544433 RepID=UPI0029C07FF6|nr:efflux RND transporter periplasmic adaptor subunit [uncultured Ilyobacter sp.]
MIKKTITLIMLTLFAACGEKAQDEAPPKEIKPVKTALIKNIEMYKRVVDNSDIEPISQVEQITEKGGEIIKIDFDNGDRVEKGQVILTIKNETVSSRYFRAKADMENKKSQMEKTVKFAKDEILKSYEEAKSAYISAKGDLAAAEKSFNEKKTTFAGNEELYKERLISEKEYREIISSFEQAKVRYESLKNGGVREKEASYLLYKKYKEDESWKYEISMAKSDYQLALAEFNAAKNDYDDLSVKAKISGVVTDMDLDLYQYIDEKKFLFSIIDDNLMKVEMGVPGEDISDIAIGKKIGVFIPDISKVIEGKVYEINPSANPATKKFTVKISLDNSDGFLKKGMYSEVRLESNPKNVPVVPKEAVMIKDLVSYIAIADNSEAKVVQIKTGMESDSFYEVISSEVSSGDKVIIQGQYLLENGDSIKEVE